MPKNKLKINKYRMYLETESPYKRPYRLMLLGLIILPLFSLIIKNFDIYLISHALIMMIFPVFVWCYLESDKIKDIKLDIAKISLSLLGYSSYLLFLYFIIIRITKFKAGLSFLLIIIFYLGLLFVITVSVAVVILIRRHNSHKFKNMLLLKK